jgi:hypothetical protein
MKITRIALAVLVASVLASAQAADSDAVKLSDKSIAQTVQAAMQHSFDTDPRYMNYHMQFGEVQIFHQQGNSYKGIADVTVQGGALHSKLFIDVTVDGDRVLWHAEPGSLEFASLEQTPKSTRCDAPPYGDTQQNYVALVDAYKQAENSQPGLPPNLLMTMTLTTLRMACEAKVSGGDRAMFHRAGLSDHYIDANGPVKITEAWVASRNKALAKEAASKPPDYQFVTVRDFVIDGPKLASASAKVKVTGSYIRQGGVEVIYANRQALIMATQTNSPGTQPSVPLLTDNAPHALRERLLNCQSDPTSAQIGCQVTVQGEATMCGLTSAFGATREMPCVHVEDGQ